MHICFFDIDGTLLRTGGAGQAAMEAALLAEFQTHRPVKGIAFAGRTDRAIVSDFFAFYDIALSDDRWAAFLQAYLRQLPKELQSRSGLVLPGILQLLQELSERDDVILGLLTGNFQQGAQLKLSHYGIHEYFAFGGFGDVHHHRDDVARAALAEAERHHAQAIHPDRLWVIGDTPADVQCARAIGAKAVAVATGSFTREELSPTHPDYLFDDFSNPLTFMDLFNK